MRINLMKSSKEVNVQCTVFDLYRIRSSRIRLALEPSLRVVCVVQEEHAADESDDARQEAQDGYDDGVRVGVVGSHGNAS